MIAERINPFGKRSAPPEQVAPVFKKDREEGKGECRDCIDAIPIGFLDPSESDFALIYGSHRGRTAVDSIGKKD